MIGFVSKVCTLLSYLCRLASFQKIDTEPRFPKDSNYSKLVHSLISKAVTLRGIYTGSVNE